MDFWIALWTALLFVATFLLAVATTALVLIGRQQIIESRKDTKGWKTVEACSRYDHDPLIEQWIRRVRTAQKSGSFAGDEPNYKMDIYPILNYFESIAIGVAQNLYVENIVYDQLGSIIIEYAEEFLDPVMAAKLAIKPNEDYVHTSRLVTSWNDEANRLKMKAD